MSEKSQYSTKEIMTMIPHRYPFLLIDKIVKIDLEEKIIIAQKNVTINEQFFVGHFPGAPIMPGVLILEALAQTGGALSYFRGFAKGRIAVLMNMKDVRFRAPVRPGDVLMLHCKEIHFSHRGGRIHAQAFVDDKAVVEAEISFAFVQPEEI